MAIDPTISPEDYPFESFQLRRRLGQLGTPALDKTNQVIQAGRIVLDAYPADRPAIGESYQGDVIEQHCGWLFRG